MTDHTESDGRDHTRHGVHEGRLLNASPVLPRAQQDSAYAALLLDIECYDIDGSRSVLDAAIAAIRALEADLARLRFQVETMREEYAERAAAHLSAAEDAERLSLKVEELQRAIKRQASSARMGMDAATKISAAQIQEAARLHADANPAAIESERAANAILTAEVARLTAVERAQDAVRDALLDERDRLTAELAAAREASREA